MKAPSIYLHLIHVLAGSAIPLLAVTLRQPNSNHTWGQIQQSSGSLLCTGKQGPKRGRLEQTIWVKAPPVAAQWGLTRAKRLKSWLKVAEASLAKELLNCRAISSQT